MGKEIFEENDLTQAINNKFKHKEMLTLKDLQYIFGKPYITIYRWVCIYQFFPYTKVGQEIFVPKISVIRYIQENNGLNR